MRRHRSLAVSLEKSTKGPTIGLDKYEGEEYWTQDQKATTYAFPKSPIAVYGKICRKKDFEDWNLVRGPAGQSFADLMAEVQFPEEGENQLHKVFL